MYNINSAYVKVDDSDDEEGIKFVEPIQYCSTMFRFVIGLYLFNDTYNIDSIVYQDLFSCILIMQTISLPLDEQNDFHSLLFALVRKVHSPLIY